MPVGLGVAGGNDFTLLIDGEKVHLQAGGDRSRAKKP